LPAVLVVHPAVAELKREISQAVVSVGAQSVRNRNRVGQGDEFFGLREYVPGDPPRTIAWKASAKTAGLVVRQLMTPAPPRVWIGLSEAPAGVTAFEQESAISLVASLAAHADRHGLSPGVIAPWAGLVVSPVENSGGLGRLLDALAGLKFDEGGEERASRMPANVTVGFGESMGEGHVDGRDPSAWAAAEVVVRRDVPGERA
jgi:uncharacterized protein (DUF58 family)